MRLTRREAFGIGGACLAGLLSGGRAAAKAGVVEIFMRGNKDGSKVWFEPAGVLVKPGSRLRWTNQDRGNAHTATAYHPSDDDHQLRVPRGATPWDSGYLLPDEAFEAMLTAPGVYDYFCIPHELAGMVGRIVVDGSGPPPTAADGIPIPGLTEDPFPPVDRILREGRVLKE